MSNESLKVTYQDVLSQAEKDRGEAINEKDKVTYEGIDADIAQFDLVRKAESEGSFDIEPEWDEFSEKLSQRLTTVIRTVSQLNRAGNPSLELYQDILNYLELIQESLETAMVGMHASHFDELNVRSNLIQKKREEIETRIEKIEVTPASEETTNQEIQWPPESLISVENITTNIVEELETLRAELNKEFNLDNTDERQEYDKLVERLNNLIETEDYQHLAEAEDFWTDVSSEIRSADPVVAAQRKQQIKNLINRIRKISEVRRKIEERFLAIENSGDGEERSIDEQIEKNKVIEHIVHFFEGGFVSGFENGEWKNKSPEQLVGAVWQYISHTLIPNLWSGENAFITIHIFEYTIPLGEGEGVPITNLLESLQGLKAIYPENASKFEDLVGQLAIDIAQIEKIYRLGKGAYDRESSPDEMISYYKDPENSWTAQDFERLATLGKGYEQLSGEPELSEQCRMMMQAYLFLHDPDYVGAAVLDTSADDKSMVFAKNVRIKSDITSFPGAVANRSDSIIKRNLLKKLVGSVSPGEISPWVQENPDLWEQKPGESNADFAARRLKMGRDYMKRQLYGAGSPGNPEPGSFYDRQFRSLNKKPLVDKEQFQGSEEEYDERVNELNELLKQDKSGVTVQVKLAEHLTTNFMEYSLMPAKAEAMTAKDVSHGTNQDEKYRYGTKGVPIDGQQRDLVVIKGKKGPTAKLYLARGFYPQMYRNKLVGQAVREGSTGPVNTMNKWFKFLDSMIDTYSFVRNGELEGVSIREALLLADDINDIRSIPFNKAIDTQERIVPWSDLLDLGWKQMQRIMSNKGMGISWHNVVMMEPGSEGTITTFNPEIANVFVELSRDVYYLLTRDFGTEVTSWDSREKYMRFRQIEKKYSDAYMENPRMSRPTDVSEKEWSDFKKAQIKPTARHQFWDGVKLSDSESDSIARYATTIHDYIWIPPRGQRNQFEDAVLSNPSNTPIRAIQKLILGQMFIGDVFQGDTSAMDAKDVRAFYKLLSKRFWEATSGEGLTMKVQEFVTGRRQSEVYNGLGYYSIEEVDAMLDEAGVPSGIMTNIRSIVTDMQKFGA